MRELKFRIWIKDEERYYDEADEESYMILPNGTVTYTSEVYEEDGEWFRDTVTVTKDVVVEQYTGLKDKNGKEIYEGDIVSEEFEYGGEKAKTIWQVRWCDDECAFELHYVSGFEVDDCWLVADDEENYKIIGNIHENPELLGEQK